MTRMRFRNLLRLLNAVYEWRLAPAIVTWPEYLAGAFADGGERER